MWHIARGEQSKSKILVPTHSYSLIITSKCQDKLETKTEVSTEKNKYCMMHHVPNSGYFTNVAVPRIKHWHNNYFKSLTNKSSVKVSVHQGCVNWLDDLNYQVIILLENASSEIAFSHWYNKHNRFKWLELKTLLPQDKISN